MPSSKGENVLTLHRAARAAGVLTALAVAAALGGLPAQATPRATAGGTAAASTVASTVASTAPAGVPVSAGVAASATQSAVAAAAKAASSDDPLRLVYVEPGGASAKVKWKKTKNTTSWVVEAYKDKKLTKRVFKLQTTATSAWIKGAKVKENTKYYVTVRTKGRPHKLISKRVTVKTGYRTPAVPTGLKVAPASWNSLAVAWNASDDALKYAIELTNTPGGETVYTKRVKAPATTSTFWINTEQMGLGREFFVRVRAIRKTAESEPSGSQPAALPFPTPWAAPSFTASIGTYNILRRGSKDAQGRDIYDRLDQIADTIAPLDIVGVQEATYAMYGGARPIYMLEEASGLTLARHPAVPPAVKGAVCSLHSDHIMYNGAKFTVVDSGEDDLGGTAADGERYATWALMTDIASGRQFYFVNTHLSSQDTSAYNQIRAGEVATLVQNMAARAAGLPVVIVGDLNEGAKDFTSTAPVQFANAGYVGADLVATTVSGGEYDTWHNFTGPAAGGRKFDYILGNSLVAFVSYTVVPATPKTQPSDHYPVFATITVY
jgi:endonuclease/exonuclease/phosphatase family metal-dependent hydrolase